MTSWLSSWFGGDSTPETRPKVGATMPTPEEMVETLGETVEDLRHKRMKAMQQVHKLTKEAKTLHAAGKMSESRACLKRRAVYQKQAEQLEAQIGNMEQTLMAVESTATGIDVAQNMKTGANAMKQLLTQTSVEEVHEAADDLQEAMTDATEIMNAVSTPFVFGEPVGEADLDAEMASWNDDGDGNDKDTIPAMPDVPVQKVVQKTPARAEKNEQLALH